ncbi:hypothetical protein K9M79_03140 [Candidatus Woesearchaeota archaeon]|nr:hypothetical protein [Candidatus Woesearchaeota archaeon]
MDNLEQIKAKKLQEMLKKREEQVNQKKAEEEDTEKQIKAIEAQVKPHMTKEAIFRYHNLKIMHPENATYALMVMHRFIEEKKIDSIDEGALKELLGRIASKKREIKIKRV